MLADPAPGNDGNDDRGVSGNKELVAYDDVAATAVAATPDLRRTTSGYRGSESDPWLALQAMNRLRPFDAREPGNVVQAAETALDGTRRQTMTLAIGLGRSRDAALTTAERSLDTGFSQAERRYRAGWEEYRSELSRPPTSVAADADLRAVYEQSLLVLAASEDKLHRGASIASPTMPWIWGTLTLEEDRRTSGPYHLVWPRDLYHVATAQEAAGDDAAADRLLDYLWRVQKADGSWWQNTFVDGREKWTTEQLDQVSLPIVLAWWLGRTSASDWAHVQRAADYLVNNEDRPRSNQERWENQDGYSPNTIATEIAGLICAADIARRNGATGKATRTRRSPTPGSGRVESWTATTNGPYSPRPYYLRVTKDGMPDNPHDLQPGRQLRPAGRPARDRGQLVPRPRPVRRQAVERPDGAQLAGGRRQDERVSAGGRRPRAGPPGTASPSTATASRTTAATGTCSSTTRCARRAGACGRCWPASAASTSCSPGAANRAAICARSPTRPTTG